ncbi:hypothetical protein RCL06_24205, partial [Salmonella enterica subsp. enterica serovar Typhimurium]
FRIVRRLLSFDSVINYAPYTKDSLRDELANRASFLPLARSGVRAMLKTEVAMALALRLLSRVDRRPGRLVSFLAEKSGTGT